MCRCLYCNGQFESESDADVCPRCEGREARALASGIKAFVPGETSDVPYSKRWMQERLSVSGEVDA